MTVPSENPPWWKNATVYQVYPASFQDSNGDGIGDIQGIISRLDYIKSLGVDAIWICPFYESPQDDLGYDISDYEHIHKPYGTMADVDALIEGCHRRGLRVIFDLVVNHTSSSHPWFKDSRSSKTSPKRNWYHWQPAKYDELGNRHPPNNWRSNFKGSAWEWDETTQEYYLHLYGTTMPDLNWECEDLRNAVYNSAMKFWLDKGIDGFRIDTMTIYAKHPQYPDAPITDPVTPWQYASKHYRNMPRVFDYHREFNDKVLSKYGELLTVGEFGDTSDLSLALKYVSAKEKRVGMGFQFETVLLGYQMCEFNVKPFSLVEFKKSHTKWQQFIEGNDGWTSVFLENHDIPRSVSRFGNDDPAFRESSAKALATYATTSTGTLFIYQGQEIGMTNIPKTWPIEEYRDVNTQNYWRKLKHKGLSRDELELAMENIQKVARDNPRTPMQWDDSPHSGFTSRTSEPWMRVNDNYGEVNVKQQLAEKNSVLTYWKKLLALRQQYIDVFAHGTFRNVDEGNTSIAMFIKRCNDKAALVICNFTSSQQPLLIPQEFIGKELLLANVDHSESNKLGPYEARIYVSWSLGQDVYTDDHRSG
jgi:alpha-glucosidase